MTDYHAASRQTKLLLLLTSRQPLCLDWAQDQILVSAAIYREECVNPPTVRNFPGQTEENHEEPQEDQCSSRDSYLPNKSVEPTRSVRLFGGGG
jgi:hypothetical protein